MNSRTKRRRRGYRRPDGYMSAFEARVGADLTARGVSFDYESVQYDLEVWETGRKCGECGSADIKRKTHYTPDFQVAGGALIVETKGRFTSRDRKVALAFVDQYPSKNYRILFMRNNTLSKVSTTTYVDWCNKHGIECAVGESVPAGWLEAI